MNLNAKERVKSLLLLFVSLTFVDKNTIFVLKQQTICPQSLYFKGISV